jgi:5'-nucleotidase
LSRPLILVTNDDGIDSPGLGAAAAALDPLGDLLIVAPAVQQTSMSRSRSQQHGADGRLFRREVRYGDRTWPGVAANATPALAVEHALQELADRPVALAVSGINYGENVGTCVTVSGTIGAAIEAAERGVPALAVSLEVDQTLHFAREQAPLDFSPAMHFVRRIAAGMLAHALPADVDLLKLEIPASATPDTPLMFTRQDRLVYYDLTIPRQNDPFDGPVTFSHRMRKGEYTGTDTDAYAIAQGAVSVTPLSIDLTARVDLDDLRAQLENPPES